MILIALTFLTCSCRSDLRKEIKAEIDRNCVGQSNNCTLNINLKDLTKFKWRRFYYFRVGTSLEQIDSALGMHYPYWQDLSESIVFLSGDSIIYHEEYEISDPEKPTKGGFSFNIGNQLFYTSKNGAFRATRTRIGGYLYYEVSPLPDGT